MNRRTATIAAFVALTGSAAAAELTVCPSGCDHTVIQDAIDAADDGDAIVIADGTYAESLIIDGAVSLASVTGTPSAVKVQGDGSQPVLTVTEDGEASIERLTLAGGGGEAGVLDAGVLDLAGCFVQQGDADYGGVYNTVTGSLWIGASSVVHSDLGALFGGGITNAGELVVENSTVIGNVGSMGGGIANIAGDAVVQRTSRPPPSRSASPGPRSTPGSTAARWCARPPI